MATLPNGFNGGMRGRIGNIVYYTNKWGNTVARTIGVKTGSKGGEFANQTATALITYLLKPVKPFIRIGFQNIPPGKEWNYHNYASSVNKLNAIKGTYPDQEVDYEKVMFAKGEMPLPANAQAALKDNEIVFTWDADLETAGNYSRDQVMVLAFFPQSMKAMFLTSGARRVEEREVLALPRFTSSMVIETYLAFISDDRILVSDSVYTGQLVWDKK
jgi:hypothetical protein